MAQDELYAEAVAAFGPPLERLARAYELDPEKRRDLLQEIHFALWRSFSGFAAQCSLRTWVYRVAHNVAASHLLKRRRTGAPILVGLDEIRSLPDLSLGRQEQLRELDALIESLEPLERQVILLYLEGEEGTSIAEITGISARNVATKIHRIKKILAERFREGVGHVR